MKKLGPIGRGIAIATLLCFAAPQAEAIQIFGGETFATPRDDGLIVQARAGRGGARHGGMHRGGGAHRRGAAHRGGMHHGVNRGRHRGAAHSGGHAHRGHAGNRHHHRNVNRNVNRYGHRNGHRNVNRYGHRNVYRNVHRGGVYRGGYYGRWARPGGYWWPAGGAIAAGAALGFVSAAAAASWAGAAPSPNLCWYYTDVSRRQGFWDACP